MSGPLQAGAAGGAWGLMPCGLLQSALLVAALASGPLQGASVMAAFALASGISLWLGPQLWRRLWRRRGADQAATASVRLAGAVLAGASLFALWHGLGAAIEDALCRVVT
jgi:sulfite exporter TauE/SafE